MTKKQTSLLFWMFCLWANGLGVGHEGSWLPLWFSLGASALSAFYLWQEIKDV